MKGGEPGRHRAAGREKLHFLNPVPLQEIYDRWIAKTWSSCSSTGLACTAKASEEGRIFNLFSPTLPALFENKDKIKTVVETTEKGATVTQTNEDRHDVPHAAALKVW